MGRFVQNEQLGSDLAFSQVWGYVKGVDYFHKGVPCVLEQPGRARKCEFQL